MKKLLLLLFTSVLLMGCGSDDNEPEGLKFVQVQVSTNDGLTAKGVSAIYYGEVTDCGNRDGLFYAKSGSETVFAIGNGNLVNGLNNTYSVKSFFFDELGTIYGRPTANMKYTIYVKISDSDYSYKTFTIEDKNKQIKVRFPTPTGEAKFVQADWSIEDYKGS